MTRSRWLAAAGSERRAHPVPALVRRLPGTWPPALRNWAEIGNIAAALVEGRGLAIPSAGGTGRDRLGAAAARVARRCRLRSPASRPPPPPPFASSSPCSSCRRAHVYRGRPQTARPLGPPHGECSSPRAGRSPTTPVIVRGGGRPRPTARGSLALEASSPPPHARLAATAGLIVVAVLAPSPTPALASRRAPVALDDSLHSRCPRARCPWPRCSPVRRGDRALALGPPATPSPSAASFRSSPTAGSNSISPTSPRPPSGLLRSGHRVPRRLDFNEAQFDRYAALGEAPFVATYRAPALAALPRRPSRLPRQHRHAAPATRVSVLLPLKNGPGRPHPRDVLARRYRPPRPRR